MTDMSVDAVLATSNAMRAAGTHYEAIKLLTQAPRPSRCPPLFLPWTPL